MTEVALCRQRRKVAQHRASHPAAHNGDLSKGEFGGAGIFAKRISIAWRESGVSTVFYRVRELDHGVFDPAFERPIGRSNPAQAGGSRWEQ